MNKASAKVGSTNIGCRLPGTWKHTNTWGNARRCINPSCLAAFSVSYYCSSCGCPTMTLQEARADRLRSQVEVL